MSDQPKFSFGPRSADAIAAALATLALWAGNAKIHNAVAHVVATFDEAPQPARATPEMRHIGWLVKWPDWEQTHLVGRDEDPRAKVWDDGPPSEVIDLYARELVKHATPVTPEPPEVPGRVTLLSELDGIWEGSSFCNLRDLGDKWLCDWPTPSGTMSNLEVPKNLCTAPKGES